MTALGYLLAFALGAAVVLVLELGAVLAVVLRRWR